MALGLAPACMHPSHASLPLEMPQRSLDMSALRLACRTAPVHPAHENCTGMVGMEIDWCSGCAARTWNGLNLKYPTESSDPKRFPLAWLRWARPEGGLSCTEPIAAPHSLSSAIYFPVVGGSFFVLGRLRHPPRSVREEHRRQRSEAVWRADPYGADTVRPAGCAVGARPSSGRRERGGMGRAAVDSNGAPPTIPIPSD